MKKLFRKGKKIIIVLLVIPALYFIYKGVFPKKSEPSYSVIEEVKKGRVKTGINATGKIVAEQKLDLNVYKKSVRIDNLNVKNGSDVKKGDIILSFDRGDVLNDLRSAELSVAQAKLALANQNISSSAPSIELSKLKNQLSILDGEIDRQEQLLGRAKRAYLSENLDVEPHEDDYEKLIQKNEPTVSGIYHGDLGEYEIEIYSSSADSGYSFRTKGLENTRSSIYFGKKVKLGSRGLFINFSSDIKTGDTWVLSIPNKNSLESAEASDSYDDQKRSLEEKYQQNLLEKKTLSQQIELEENNDAKSIRSLRKSEKKLELSRAYQALSDAQKIADERNIIAPFDGTITGMRNVVVGTKPRNDSEDPVVLGKLVSHNYFVTFSLSLVDVAKIGVGKKVELNVPALPSVSNLKAIVTEVDILPKNDGLAQYEVRALIDISDVEEEFILREGLTADITIIEQEKNDVIRVPKVALNYDLADVSVLVLDATDRKLSDAIEKQGGIDLSKHQLKTKKVSLELGVSGKNYVEVLSGLSEGDYIVSTISTKKTESLFGGPDEGDDGDEF